jgi:predicted glycogen debranching enzyme
MIHFGREVTGNLDAILRREWLVTNGIGGYAMGSLAGARTRRYHGLLITSLQPPTRRVLMVANLDAWVEIDGRRSPLVTHEWAAGVVLPDGYRHLESFRLEGTIPVFVWAVGDVQIVQRIWMAYGKNTTYVTYTYTRGTSNVSMVIQPLCTYRDHHKLTKGGYQVDVQAGPAPWPGGPGITILPHPDRAEPVQPFRILSNLGTLVPGPEWWWSFHLAEEKRRGLDNQEDLFAAGTLTASLKPGNTVALAFTAEPDNPAPWHDALVAEQQRQRDLLERADLPPDAPDWIRQLVLAADQFIVTRDISGQPGRSILGGYPWFSDWGRDTMVALPGLTLATGRRDDGGAILETFARFVDQGMLPNRFPDAGQAPEYNTADATLWYFLAIYACYQAEGCAGQALSGLYDVLTRIIECHVSGTRFNIRVDPTDGLLFAGEPGLQLTWMDVKIDDWVVTPRIGKPVEINALWYNALRILAELATTLGHAEDAARYTEMADRVQASFDACFWYSGGYLYDVVDGMNGDDSTLRPNQIFAVSLPFPLLDGDKARAVVDICARELLVSYGLRSLAPDEADYVGAYGGDQLQRDSAYHQGTAWAWLMGPFVSAHYRVYGNPHTAWSYLEPMADHLNDHGLGTISEIFDGDPPHAPRGCIAQAWSVAEVLRVYRSLESALKRKPNG